MKELTKAEEQAMQHIWQLDKAFLKDIVNQFPKPRPAYTTIATVVKKLVEKEFVGFQAYGKVREYYPLISKEDYFKSHLTKVVNNFFKGSISSLASAFTENENVSISELEKLKQLIEDKIKHLKEEDE